jgi:predicted GIY-YIG superfamily endonuclease
VKYVYLIQSINNADQRYVGITSDLQQRLKDHNSGKSPHTSKYMPWKIVTVVRFSDDKRAADFEHYLKSASGKAFANKHLW